MITLRISRSEMTRATLTSVQAGTLSTVNIRTNPIVAARTKAPPIR